ncbi:leucyl aminopeptidase family protein [Micromonospora peucetia]|uniref:Probable cytosol aminopeptidase n=1 Tax=Micromonospora peucetia TaxID=47871 RepID=A0A1C6UJR6_9ACTN|nr:leucyl aminopeptidase family protein [Micromonospora peucetia]MCX4386886.1 leucyl aminopeptidase family protein [Micromonospora peucetia]WSA34201.1 leucyl aminopeptidase family protein [Micromonospora peucetia]SCL54287.1 leucyl aminopeptidase [Micromonospora peucetia]
MLAIRLLAEPDRLDTLVLPVWPGPGDDDPARPAPTAATLPDGVVEEAAALVPAARLTGRPGEVQAQLRPGRDPGRLLLLGVGEGDEAGWRTAGAALARAGKDETHITLAMPAEVTPAAVRGLVEGLLLASYRFRLTDAGSTPALAGVDVVVADPDAYTAVVELARTTARMTRFARDLTNTPSSTKNPEWFADQVATLAADVPDLHLRVRGPDELAAEGFGGILAVGGGSASGPRLVELDWRPADARIHVVLVGKGITFDTGGISIKPVASMKLMRKDMAGAAAVVAATLGAAALRLPVRVTTLAPLAENMLSGSAFRPGDIIRHYGGTTSETTNSDAEGRLVLADALGYAVAELKPDLLVDLATLTGANAVALGKRMGALYSDNEGLAADVLAAISAAGEAAWRMPLPADYAEHLGSELADLHSSPDRGAGSVMAALYLREFTGGLRDRWLHVDMSAPSWADGDDAELTRGATGWGVRSLLRWLGSLG